MNPILFPLVATTTMLFIIVALFLTLPNPVQKRFTEQNRAGYGLLVLGAALFGIACAFATGALPHLYRSYDLGIALAMLIASPAGLCLGLGITIAPPDSITDKVLDQKNLWILGLVLITIVTVLTIVIQ